MADYTEVAVDAAYLPGGDSASGRVLMARCAYPADHIYLAVHRDGAIGTSASTVWLDVEEIDELIDALYCLREEIEPYEDEDAEDGDEYALSGLLDALRRIMESGAYPEASIAQEAIEIYEEGAN